MAALLTSFTASSCAGAAETFSGEFDLMWADEKKRTRDGIQGELRV